MAGERQRLSPAQRDIIAGHAGALWVRTDGLRRASLRVLAEWLDRANLEGNLHISGSRIGIEAYLVS